jgi:signal transduction histidine kinase
MTEWGLQHLALAEKELQRVASITKRTLRLFRDNASREELSLPNLLDETMSLYRSQLAAHSIQVVTEYRGGRRACVSRGGIEQVFANLISNAIDAMAKGGTLTVRIADVAGGDKNASIRVEIEDTGEGIADHDLDRVFDLFFTTKQNRGTGLGLWVAKEIVAKHGGTIAVTSPTLEDRKGGTRFSIVLPRPTLRIGPVPVAA